MHVVRVHVPIHLEDLRGIEYMWFALHTSYVMHSICDYIYVYSYDHWGTCDAKSSPNRELYGSPWANSLLAGRRENRRQAALPEFSIPVGFW